MAKVLLEEPEVDLRDNSIACVCGGRAFMVEERSPNLSGKRLTKHWFRVCPDCSARYQCNASGKPLSMPADRKTGWMRTKAHDAFDKLWKTILGEEDFQQLVDKVGRNKSRTIHRAIKTRRDTCYAWLAAQLGLPHGRDASIGRLNASQCANVIAVCELTTWADVEAWDRARKGKSVDDVGPRKAAIQKRKSKRRAARLLGSEEEEWEEMR